MYKDEVLYLHTPLVFINLPKNSFYQLISNCHKRCQGEFKDKNITTYIIGQRLGLLLLVFRTYGPSDEYYYPSTGTSPFMNCQQWARLGMFIPTFVSQNKLTLVANAMIIVLVPVSTTRTHTQRYTNNRRLGTCISTVWQYRRLVLPLHHWQVPVCTLPYVLVVLSTAGTLMSITSFTVRLYTYSL
jgi:hypothetical protein